MVLRKPEERFLALHRLVRPPSAWGDGEGNVKTKRRGAGHTTTIKKPAGWPVRRGAISVVGLLLSLLAFVICNLPLSLSLSPCGRFLYLFSLSFFSRFPWVGRGREKNKPDCQHESVPTTTIRRSFAYSPPRCLGSSDTGSLVSPLFYFLCSSGYLTFLRETRNATAVAMQFQVAGL